MGFVFDMPFEDIPIWMPPSPPISEAGHPLDLYSPIDGALLYLPKPIPESELPPLPPLISSFDVSPRTGRISPRKIFGVVSRTDVKRHMTGFGTQKAPNGRISREGQQRLVDRKEQQYVRQSAERTAGGMLSPPESAPNTPMAVPSVPTTANTPAGVDPINAQTATTAEVPRTSEKLPPAMSQSPTVKSSLSTLDESIESTLRKSRKHLQSTVPHYLTRNIGTPPQRPMEPLLTDRSKTVYKLLCPEWRNSPNPTPITSGEPPDYEGQAWNAHEDRRLLKAICVKHSLTTEMVTRCSGLQINWDFVSQYVNLGTNVHRSPRQCALRYINFVLRCDDIVEEGPKKGSSAQRRQRSSAAAPHSVVVDYHYCVQTAATVVRRRTGQMAEVAQIRRRANSVHERAEQSQSQLLCLAGRLPPQQEFRLSELGARYSNAMRASDVLDLRRQNQKRRQRQQQMASQQHGR